MSNETNPGAGGKGSAGYWGFTDDEKREEAYEKRYRQLIPKNEYLTTAHSIATCKVCTFTNILHFCPQHGFGFGPLPIVNVRENNWTVTKCARCGIVRKKVKAKGNKK